MKRYIDSNVFIYPVLFADDKAKRCRAVLQQIVSREIQAATSVLTWDEFTYIIQRNLGREIAIAEGEKFLHFPNLLLIETNAAILAKAQQLLSEFNIRPRDAIHAATAILQGVTEIISDDPDFDKIKTIRRIPAM